MTYSNRFIDKVGISAILALIHRTYNATSEYGYMLDGVGLKAGKDKTDIIDMYQKVFNGDVFFIPGVFNVFIWILSRNFFGLVHY